MTTRISPPKAPAPRPSTKTAPSSSPAAARPQPKAAGYGQRSEFSGTGRVSATGGGSIPASKSIPVTPINPNVDGRTDDYAPKYKNGDGFCGPTSMLMAARALGYSGSGTAAQQIIRLAETGGYKDLKGVPASNFDVMAQSLGMQVTQRGGQADVPGGPTPPPLVISKPGGGYQADHTWLRQQLAAGHPVIINVPNGTGPGHWKVLAGYDTAKSPPTYTVCDPWDGSKKTDVPMATVDEQIRGGNGTAFALSKP